MKKVIDYFKNSVKEFNNVTWPTKNQAIRISAIVFVFMIISAIILGIVDYLLTIGYQTLLK